MKICILGSTGSIGRQALEVVNESEQLELVAIGAGQNVDVLESQIRRFVPKYAAMSDACAAKQLRLKVADTKTKVCQGREGIDYIAALQECDMVLCAISGFAGLQPLITAIQAGKDIALANKEAMVVAGDIINLLVKKNGVSIFPVDSEHSAVFQALGGSLCSDGVKRIILTASGGPFHGEKREQLKNVTPCMALNHPNWSMGSKITVDSATLMNKALEIIEARYLFGMTNIQMVVHKESVVHSMVEFVDNSVIAQMGMPDMRLPISYALNYGKRCESIAPVLDITQIGSLNFCKPDTETFRAPLLAYRAMELGGTALTVLNTVNEIAVEMFLREQIGFLDIARLTEQELECHKVIVNPTIEQIVSTDKQIRKEGLRL